MTKYSLYLNGENNHIEVPSFNYSLLTEKVTLEFLFYNVKKIPDEVQDKDAIRLSTCDKWIWIVELWQKSYPVTNVLLTDADGNARRLVFKDLVYDVGWHHFLVRYDGSKIELIDNSNVIAYKSYTYGVYDYGERLLRIGQYFQGFIGFVRIYNRALSDSEIEWNFENPYEPVSDGLVLWLLMDEGEGDVVYDKSGNGNDGTIYGAEWVRSPVLQWSPVKIGEVTVYPSSVKWSYEGGVRAVRFLGAECGLVYASTGKVEEEVEVEVKNKVSDSFLSDIEMLKSYIGEEVYVKFSYFPVYPMIVSSVEKREETHNMLSVFIKLKPVM